VLISIVGLPETPSPFVTVIRFDVPVTVLFVKVPEAVLVTIPLEVIISAYLIVTGKQ